MKMISERKYILGMLAIITVGSVFPSCLKEEKENFSEGAAARVQATLTTVRTILRESEYGWRMEYFAGNSETEWGGHNFALRFDDENVTSWGESSPDDSVTTLYSLAATDGPVLSFDTYNSSLHYYATPSSVYYEAMGGDFSFRIVSCSKEEIILCGLRNLKTVRMYPLSEKPEEYISDVKKASDDFIVSILDGKVGGTQVTGAFDLTHRQMSLSWQDSTGMEYSIKVPYITTLSGIKLYERVEVAGEVLSSLDYDPHTRKFSTSSYDADTELIGSLPADYVPYSGYAGEYTLNYWNDSAVATVRLEPAVQDETYLMSGLSNLYTLVLNYDRATGRLHLNSQKIGETNDGNSIWFCAWNASSGSLSWNTSAGMQTVWNKDEKNPVYTFVSNDYDYLPEANSFIFWLVDSDNLSAGQYQSAGLDPYGKSMFVFMGNLVKN